MDNYDGDVDDKHDNYAAYLDDNSLSYSFGPDSNLDEVQNNLNDIETNGVIIWQRRKDEYILLPHSAFPLEKSKLGSKSGNNSDALLNTSILFLISTSVNPMEFLDSLGHGGLGYPKERQFPL